MKRNLFIILLFFSCITACYSQNVFYGIPKNIDIIDKGDLIIMNEIHWQNSYTQFSDIGLSQIEEINALLEKMDTNKLEIGIHFFYGASSSFCEKISQQIAEKLELLLKNKNTTKIYSYGCSKPFATLKGEEKIYYKSVNTRVEIKIL